MTEALDTTQAPEGASEGSTLEQRAEAILADLQSADASEPASADDSGASHAANPPAGDAVEAGADSGAPTDPATAREQRLAALREKATADAEERQKRAAVKERETEFEEWKRRATEAEARAASLVDVSNMDPDTFLETANRMGITPERLGEWVRQGIEDPAQVATEAARRAVTPEVEALRQMVQAQNQKLAELEQRGQISAEQANHAAAVNELLTATNESTEAPLAAAYLRELGPEKFLEYAASTAAELPNGAGMQAVLDVVEDALTRTAKVFSSTQPSAPPTSAAAKADTISNRHASARAEVTTPTEWDEMSFDDRADWLIKHG